MKGKKPDELADVTAAFLIGAGLGVAATILLRPLRPAQPRRIARARRLARRRPFYHELRNLLATLGDR